VKDLLLVDAGDLFFKKFIHPISEGETDMFTQKAQVVVDAFNIMGYDAVGVGDDDLALGKEALVNLSKKAKFPFLSSNLLDEGTGKPLFLPYLVKDLNGLRVGIFSLLSPEAFMGPSDPRRKGILLRPPAEAAQATLKELQSKADFIILLSHLGFQKDNELAQGAHGIDLIIGAHTGMNLSFPPVVKNTIIVQTGTKGMYAGRLDLALHPQGAGFYNLMTRRSAESSLAHTKSRLNAPNLPEPEKIRLQKAKEDGERALKQYQGKNEFSCTIASLTDEMKDHPEVLKLVESYRQRYPDSAKPQPSR
jgi:2',3'-cyclic-nucleotide 2'-phosphodiesterase (5'-nucleotidase family)